MKNVLIAEDHPIMRAGTRQIVSNFLPGAVITEVDTFKKAVHSATETQFDLAILDIDIPGGNSVKMIEVFKQRWPNVKILVFSSYDENLYALPFIKAGADGYVSKDAPELEFKNAIETILFRNKVYVSEALREESFNQFIRVGPDRDTSEPKLSVREREIVGLLLSGKTVSEIAAKLDLHVSTVSTHRGRIFQKMKVDNMMDLARKLDVIK